MSTTFADTAADAPALAAVEPVEPAWYSPGSDSALRRTSRLRRENAQLRERIADLEAALANAHEHERAHPREVDIEDLRAALMDEALGKGANCVVCGRLAKVYRRSISDAQARSLAEIFDKHGHEWASLPDDGDNRHREEHKLRYWGLLEESTERREDGGRGGMWRVTALGARWVCGQVTVPKYAYTYQNRVLRLDGEQRSFADALKEPFDLRSIMVDTEADLTPQDLASIDFA